MNVPKRPQLDSGTGPSSSGSGPQSGSDPAVSGETATSPLAVGEVVAGKYRVDELLAIGGMGSVLRARHLQLGHDVALKVLRPEKADGAQAIPRFLREARAAAAIRSDHVVRIHDVGTLDSGLPFMVLELLEGSDVRALLRERKTFSVVDAVDTVLQAAEGIAEAHRLGVVHRDLKPSNLFALPKRGGRQLVKVLDFGVSKVSRAELADDVDLTTTRTLVGSPSYMSPEQVRDPKNVDHRSDIWSLGVILHQLLAGHTPFRCGSVGETYAAILGAPNPRLHRSRRDVSMELQAVVDRCLEKEPQRRFQTMEELIEALTPFASELDAGARISGEQPSEPRASKPAMMTPPPPPRASLPPADEEIAVQIAAAIARELAAQGIPGEVRLSGDEVRLIGSASRIAAPLGVLAREWHSLAPELRERRVIGAAQRLASEYRVKAKRDKPPSALVQSLMVLFMLALAGLAVWALWTFLGRAIGH